MGTYVQQHLATSSLESVFILKARFMAAEAVYPKIKPFFWKPWGDVSTTEMAKDQNKLT